MLSASISEDVRSSLARLVMRYPGAFSAHAVAEDTEASRTRALVEKYRTFHPTLLEGADKKAIWVETFHDAKSVYAYGVRFVSPAAMSSAELASFDEYRADFDLLFATANPLVGTAKAPAAQALAA